MSVLKAALPCTYNNSTISIILQDMHIKVEVTMQQRLQVKFTESIFTIAMFNKDRNSFILNLADKE